MNNSANKNLTITEGTFSVPSVILRKCCACQNKFPRENLIRILKEHKTGSIIINPSNTDFGRSTYLCKNEECFKIALKKKRLKNLNENEIEMLKKLTNL